MLSWWRTIVGLLGAWGGVVLWSVDLTLLQPLTEPDKPWHDLSGENNTYWARDLRWAAIPLVVAGLVLAFRGDRRWAAFATCGGVAWFGVDIALDRFDVEGPVAAAVTAVLVVVLVTAVAVVGLREISGRYSTGAERAPLLIAGSVPASLVPIVATIESPTDTEAGLTWMSLGVGVLAAVLAVALAVAAAPSRTRGRVLSAVVVTLAAAGAVTYLRFLPPGDRMPEVLVLAGVLLAAFVALAHDRPAPVGWLAYAGLALVLGVVFPVVFVVLFLLSMYGFQLADLFTALAGNPLVNAADEDAVTSLVAVWIGLGFGLLVVVAERLRAWFTRLGPRLRGAIDPPPDGRPLWPAPRPNGPSGR
ncbi:hypothetical protein [Longispora urticae]